MTSSPISSKRFLLFFTLLCTLSALELGALKAPLLLFLSAFWQSGIEVLLCTLIASLLTLYALQKILTCYAAALTLLCIFHIVDLVLVRLFDFTIWYALSFVALDRINSFSTLLSVSDVSYLSWGAVFASIAALLLAGALFFKKTQKIPEKCSLLFSLKRQGALLCAFVLLSVGTDAILARTTPFPLLQTCAKGLPFKTTCLKPPSKTVCMHLPESSTAKPQALLTSSTPLPDIYLFVVESVREDAITKEVAPHLSAFKQHNLFFEKALAGSNGSQLSWAALFFSKHPFDWTSVHQGNTYAGAPPLALFRERGYSIELFSSSDLRYYRMDEALFGSKRHLASRYVVASPSKKETWQKDQEIVEKVSKRLLSALYGPPRLTIIFLDSTHFHYSFPKSQTLFPSLQGLNYWGAVLSKQMLRGVKNNYLNALHHVDALFGSFLFSLYQSERGQNAIVLFTADHGEEFGEKGHLFHASELTKEQTHIPLYYSFGKGKGPPLPKTTELTSHIDIFPTLAHILFNELNCFEGASVFDANHPPFVLTARFNACFAPTEFALHSTTHKLLLRRKNENSFHFLKLTTLDDTLLPAATEEIKSLFAPCVN